MPALRVALLGAFCFPAPQGSQVFTRDQATALARVGASVRVVSYGNGVGDAPADVELCRVPDPFSPRSYRSGLHPMKPLADALLLARLRRSLRERPADAILAHNAEAALVALLADAAPTVYVAHTLVEEELSAYGPAPLASLLTRWGRALDRFVARRVDAALVLSELAAQRLGPSLRGPLEVVPPGVERRPPPGPEEVAAVCRRFGLAPDAFVLYAGNLDAYQELDVLRQTAARLPECVFAVATHARRARDLSPLRVAVATPEETRVLTHAAAVAVATRGRPGGFPIKLLNYMEAGRAIVAREGQAGTLESGRNALLVRPDAGAGAFAAAIGSLLRDPARAAALGREARATAAKQHDWDAIARRTLDLVGRITRRA